jgi:hypothetical protein
MNAFEERAAQNEVLFRSVNEEIEKLGRADTERLRRFVCECSDGTCTEEIQLTVAEYEAVRSQSRWFAIVPGHVTGEIEHVIRSTERYLVVEKDTPGATEIVELTDPRD